MAHRSPFNQSSAECSFRSLSAPIRLLAQRAIRRALLLTAAAVVNASAQSAPPPAISARAPTPADSAIRITLLTMGQGDQVYEMFGHNAIWVHDPALPVDVVYNWGVFDFNTPGFLGRFLLGDMRYVMNGETIENTLAIYKYLNRRIWAQELDLSASEKRALVDYIAWNAQPENRQYRYDYYLDNCSTRVRDLIDRVLGGQLRGYLRAIPTGETYRSHSLRMMQSAKPLVTGVELALGRRTDVPLTADETSFLPVQLMGHIRGFKRADGRPLVTREYLLSDASRGPEPEHVPALWKGLLPIGLALAGVILGLFYRTSARRTTATLVAVFAGVVGLLGAAILFLVTATDHVAAHGNENMFMVNPIWLVIAVAVPMLLLRGRASRVARWAIIAGAALSLGAVVIHLIGMSRQPNWDMIGLLLPPQLAIAAITFTTLKRRVTPGPRVIDAQAG